MKNLSIVVPCYNSEDYMNRCIDSLLIGDDKTEIIIVNDGSTDKTAEIAEAYQEKFPAIVKAVHQINGGHGEAVNTGLAHATGRYIKIVDSDDWVDAISYQTILDFLAQLPDESEMDMLISNYVYEKVGVKHKKVVNYQSFLPKDKLFDWEKVTFPVGKYLLMHSIIYRTSLLKEMSLKLPKHTFYVDNLYAFQPLPFVRKMYYLDVDFYRYYIGREDQSVNEQVMIKRIDQQLFVNRALIDYYVQTAQDNPYLDTYMRQYLEIITVVSSVLLMKYPSAENLSKKEALWAYIQERDTALYAKLRRSILGNIVNLPGNIGRKTTIGIYRVIKKIYGFN